MSWTQVDFSLVRYSPVEGTHYFFDPNYPTAIQFLLDGQWESWDVGWVKHKAQDPDIRRIAEDAETQLTRLPDSTYRQWPSAPPPGPGFGDHAPPQDHEESPLPSPSDQPYPDVANEDHLPSLVAVDSDISPPQPQTYPTPVPSSQPQSQPQPASYTSPYGAHPAAPTPNGNQPAQRIPASVAGPSRQPPPPPSPSLPDLDFSGPSNGVQQHADPPVEPPQQPAGVPPIVLSKNRETKVLLSLDGDGVRGLSQVLLVESLVNAICTRIGAQVDPYQIFDLIGGNSMGGVLGIMLSRLRMQAHRAREAYKVIAKEVFPNKRDFFTSFDPHALPVTYDGQGVENAIKGVVTREAGHQEELLYDSRDDSADVFVVSTRIDIGTNKAALMRSYQTRRITGPELDANMTIWQAMRATSVAPRYMQPRTGVNWRPVIEPGLVDHGTAKNNPIRDILYECRKLYRYANDMMVIVSIGTGHGFDFGRELPEMGKSVNDRTLEAGVWGEKFEADHQALMERGWMKYYRFNVPELNDVPLEEWCHEERIKEKTLAYLGRPDVGQGFYACVDAITAVLLGGQHLPR